MKKSPIGNPLDNFLKRFADVSAEVKNTCDKFTEASKYSYNYEYHKHKNLWQKLGDGGVVDTNDQPLLSSPPPLELTHLANFLSSIANGHIKQIQLKDQAEKYFSKHIPRQLWRSALRKLNNDQRRRRGRPRINRPPQP